VNAHEYAFVVVATIGSIAAVAVVTARNVVHAALYLVVTLAAVGMTFLLLGAEFVGWVQILIYVGAIVILFLFGLMLTKAPIGRDTLDYQNRAIGAVVAVVVAIGLGSLILQAWPLRRPGQRVVQHLRAPVRGRFLPAPRGVDRRHRAGPAGRGHLT